MRVLDEWLNYIDSDEILPLFEEPDNEYTISKLQALHWEDYTEATVAVVRDRNLSRLRTVDSVSELRTMFDLFNQHNEKKVLRDTFSHMLDLEASSSCSM